MTRIGEGSGAAVAPTPDDSPVGAPVPADIATRAAELGVRVQVTRTSDGQRVTLTDEQLADLAANPARLADYGIPAADAPDFFRAIDLANRRGVRGATVDLTRNTATERIYDGVASNVGADARVALIRPNGTDVATGLGNSFDIRGQGVETRDIGFWEKLANVLLQILTRLLIFGWFAPPDTPEAKRENFVRDNAATVAMAGGSDLRRMIAPPVDPAQARGRVEELIRRANPNVSAATVTETARLMVDELTRIYQNPAMTDARLDSLRSSASRATAQDFGGNAGHWLRERLNPAQAQQRFSADALAARSPAEMQAVLTLNVPGYDTASTGEQTRLASQFRQRAGELGEQGRNVLGGLLRAGVDLPRVQAMNQVMGHASFSGLPDAAQSGLIGYASSHPGDMPAIESMLANAQHAGRGNGTAFVAAMNRVDPSNAAQVTEFNDLVGGAAFRGLTPRVRGDLLQASGVGRSANLTALLGHANFSGLTAERQAGVAAALARVPDPLGPDLITGIQNGTFSAAQIEEVSRVANAPGFARLNRAEQTAVLEAVLRGGAKPGLGVAIGQLIDDPAFQSLPEATRTSVVSQVRNYPNVTTATNLRRMVHAEWFRDPRAADLSPGSTVHQHQQRSAAMVAYTSGQIDLQTNLAAPTAGQQESTRILQNSLGQFLPTLAADGRATQARFRVSWNEIDAPPGSTTWGYADDNTLTLNRTMIPASDAPVPGPGLRLTPPRTPSNATNPEHLLLNTMPHEVNHLMNGDRVRGTFEYFQGEYGAWYVGYVAEHGREPTRRECYVRAQYLLTRTEGSYRHLRNALLETNRDGTPKAEAQQMIAFMQQFFAPPLPTNAAGVVALPHAPPNPGQRTNASRPPAGQNRNMDNGGAPHAQRGSGRDLEPHVH